MIASVRGSVISKAIDRAVVEVGGIGLEVLATPSTLAELHEGKESHLYTALIVREDALTLYGFANAKEKTVFEALIGVSRIGPKLAITALAALGADGLCRAVQKKDEGALTRIPGVGKKSAQRLLIEIGDRLGEFSVLAGSIESRSNAQSEVATALVQLGWSEVQAREAIGSIDSDLNTPDALRAALAWLGARHG